MITPSIIALVLTIVLGALMLYLVCIAIKNAYLTQERKYFFTMYLLVFLTVTVIGIGLTTASKLS